MQVGCQLLNGRLQVVHSLQTVLEETEERRQVSGVKNVRELHALCSPHLPVAGQKYIAETVLRKPSLGCDIYN